MTANAPAAQGVAFQKQNAARRAAIDSNIKERVDIAAYFKKLSADYPFAADWFAKDAKDESGLSTAKVSPLDGALVAAVDKWTTNPGTPPELESACVGASAKSDRFAYGDEPRFAPSGLEDVVDSVLGALVLPKSGSGSDGERKRDASGLRMFVGGDDGGRRCYVYDTKGALQLVAADDELLVFNRDAAGKINEVALLTPEHDPSTDKAVWTRVRYHPRKR